MLADLLFAGRRSGVPDVQSALSAPESHQLRAGRGCCHAVHRLGPVLALCAGAHLCIPPSHLEHAQSAETSALDTPPTGLQAYCM